MDWVKNNPPIYCLQETRFRSKDTNRLKVEEQKGIFMHIITKEEQDGNTNIRQSIFNKKVTKQRERHYILVKDSIQQDEM